MGEALQIELNMAKSANRAADVFVVVCNYWGILLFISIVSEHHFYCSTEENHLILTKACHLLGWFGCALSAISMTILHSALDKQVFW